VSRYSSAEVLPINGYIISTQTVETTVPLSTMRPHIRRILTLRPLRPPNRLFTRFERPRPQLPFLSQPPRNHARWLTTERRAWIKSEFKFATKATLALWSGGVLLSLVVWGVLHERLEREFPTPHEWSFWSRMSLRSAYLDQKPETDESYGPAVDWAATRGHYLDLVERLENPAIDGKDLKEQDEGGILVEGVGKTGYDITNKSEPWRRGYHEALMGCAKAAEHLDGKVLDTTRRVVFPAESVIGPSNPNPRPLPPGAVPPPKEEHCVAASSPPETYYMRILTTRGFTDRQKLDAALGYAMWLDYKGTPDAAGDMYKWALDIATASSTNPESLIDTNGAIKTDAGAVSTNLLDATTALAVHHARNANVSVALPILLSVLRARRSLPSDITTKHLRLNSDSEEQNFLMSTFSLIKSTIAPPEYPPPPDDGTTPPIRNAKEKCEEAAVMTYIGEILYASKSSTSGREEGLAWTREAVDIADEELRGKAENIDKEARKTCRACLETGLSNWNKMVSKLAREEQEQKIKAPARINTWLGFGGELAEESVGRWESEKLVVQERTRRARDLLAAQTNSGSWFGEASS
jgi:hypothetical protein